MKKVEKEPEKESVSNLGSVRRRDSSTTIKRHKINKNLSRDSEINIELDKNEQNTTANVASVSRRISCAKNLHLRRPRGKSGDFFTACHPDSAVLMKNVFSSFRKKRPKTNVGKSRWLFVGSRLGSLRPPSLTQLYTAVVHF